MLILLSYKIDEKTPFYGGGKGFSRVITNSIEKGDSANTQKWEFPNHLGTHIDFSYHFYQNGRGLEKIPEKIWKIKGEKIQILQPKIPNGVFLIEQDFFEKKDLNFDAKLLLFKTNMTKYRNEEKFWKYNPGLSIETTEWVLNNFKKLKIIGLDSISISSWQHRDIGRRVHKKLLNPKKPVLIIEDMDLSRVNTDTIFKEVVVAPLMVKNSDGGPCTIFAEVEK